MKVIQSNLASVNNLLEISLLEKYKNHVSQVKRVFEAFYAALSGIFRALGILRSKLESNENASRALYEAAALLKTIFYEKKFVFYDPVQILEFLECFEFFDKFVLYIHSVSHIEVTNLS